MICFQSFFTLQNSYNYARNFTCTFLEAICSLQLTAVTQLGSQTSFLPANWPHSASVPNFCAQDLEEDKAMMDQEVQSCLSALCCYQTSWCCSEEEAKSHGGGQEPWEREKDKHSREEKTQDMGASPVPTHPAIALHCYLLTDGRSVAQMDIYALGYKISFHITPSKVWVFSQQ